MSGSDEMIQFARFAEQAEMYDKMRDCMKMVVQDKRILSVEERNLLSVAYKNVVGARRASWRVLNSIMERRDNQSNANDYFNADIVKQYRSKVEAELEAICGDVLELLEDVLLHQDLDNKINDQAKVFYHKMQGDYYRYLAEFQTNQARERSKQQAERSYQNALEVAEKLKATNPIRLGLALNFSVFHYEILRNPPKACKIAKDVFDLAVAELDDLPEEEYKDATLIMQLLRDNLTLWQAEERGGAEVEQDLEMYNDGEDDDF